MSEVPPVLLLGDPRLRMVCAPVSRFDEPELTERSIHLLQRLALFRRAHGFGRGIAAPQIGDLHRMIALHLPGWPPIIVNPRITWRSERTMTLWDDCMSFPLLLVRLRRAESISLVFQDLQGHEHHRERLDPAVSELLQHEIDHLDGILALDRAIDSASLVARAVFEADRAGYLAQVDYTANHDTPSQPVPAQHEGERQ